MAQIGFFPNQGVFIDLEPSGDFVPTRIRQPITLFGCAGVLVRGGMFARRIREVLYPIQRAQQLDSAFSTHYGHLHAYMSARPLVFSLPAEFGDTDIQSPVEEDFAGARKTLEKLDRKNVSAASAAIITNAGSLLQREKGLPRLYV
eukprot:gnl/TRDRNA2_/TRDRNA2_93382_c1_seq1.p1 gnl/TRDRNA2_/TRDRNA2_93382_c1~~gnl/TRDRNA2_/TRDRNA2_93382_c1_seq1.p1  ORF type:complete len:154 (-),score=13.31 gnl/TRDRNA2_/TRDRNA2_93382_c1_seq1:97-534(-)